MARIYKPLDNDVLFNLIKEKINGQPIDLSYSNCILGVFNQQEAKEVVEIIDKVNQKAVAV